MSDALDAVLACPLDGTALQRERGSLACPQGHRYPEVDGVPVLMPEGFPPTMAAQAESLRRAYGRSAGDPRAPELHLESLGVNDEEKAAIASLWRAGERRIDPVVRYLLAATCGIGYAKAGPGLADYPIPPFPVPGGGGGLCLDVGCNWGRWSFAAGAAGYRAVGLDPQLGAVLAATRVARQLGSSSQFVCGDARRIPLRSGSVDLVFSYSVLQHFDPRDCATSLAEIGRVLRPGGVAVVQMANALGVRSAYHLARRAGRAPEGFEVRYYRPRELLEMFARNVGAARLEADCFFGLGLQPSDMAVLTPAARAATRASELLKRIARVVPPLARLADSVYLVAVRT